MAPLNAETLMVNLLWWTTTFTYLFVMEKKYLPTGSTVILTPYDYFSYKVF